MNVLILNKNFESILLVENYQSLIWNDRYNEAGDFELYIPASAYDRTFYEIGYYVYCSLSENRLMIIEKVSCKTDVEDGDFVTITGRSLESVLMRRILIGGTTVYNGNFQDMIEKMFDENITNPINSDRKISNIIFKHSSDKQITELTMEAEYDGDNMYEVIVEQLNNHDLGMRMTKDSNNNFVFELYKGVDRSYKQSTIPWVVFSPEFDNLLDSEYYTSEMNYKNYAYVRGDFDYEVIQDITEEDGTTSSNVINETKQITIEVGKKHTGIERYECFVDANDVQSRTMNEETGEHEYITEDSFNKLLQQEGISSLGGFKKYTKFDCEIDYTHTFKINKDYFLGDIVQVSNQYGYSGSFRINEFVISASETGIECYPVFVNTEKEDDENEL